MPFPSLFESQLPLYFTEVANHTLKLNPEETIYTLWIGTNDVGGSALLTGHGAAGITLVDTVSCAVNWIKVLYQSGARNFLFQNVCVFFSLCLFNMIRLKPRKIKQMIPLQHTILYSPNSYPNRYWTAQRNTTEWSVTMTELVNSGNEISKLMLQTLPASLPGAHIGM